MKRAHVGSFLDLEKILITAKDLDDCELPARNDIKATISHSYPCPGPNYQQNKADVFLSAFLLHHFLIHFL